MHINVLPTHFDIIQEIVNTKFLKKFPNFIKNQSPWFFDKDLMDELEYVSKHLFISGLR